MIIALTTTVMMMMINFVVVVGFFLPKSLIGGYVPYLLRSNARSSVCRQIFIATGTQHRAIVI